MITAVAALSRQKKHTITLSNDEGIIKADEIQPLWRTVKVSGDSDTDVVFTDVEKETSDVFWEEGD